MVMKKDRRRFRRTRRRHATPRARSSTVFEGMQASELDQLRSGHGGPVPRSLPIRRESEPSSEPGRTPRSRLTISLTAAVRMRARLSAWSFKLHDKPDCLYAPLHGQCPLAPTIKPRRLTWCCAT